MKPDPEIYHILLDALQVEAEDCIFIDDIESNIETATQLGFIGIHFSTPDELRDQFEKLGIL